MPSYRMKNRKGQEEGGVAAGNEWPTLSPPAEECLDHSDRLQPACRRNSRRRVASSAWPVFVAMPGAFGLMFVILQIVSRG